MNTDFIVLGNNTMNDNSKSELQREDETAKETNETAKQPLPRFGFGLIADVQWADIEDGSNFAKTSVRHYRGAFETLIRAVDWWSELNNEHKKSNKPIIVDEEKTLEIDNDNSNTTDDTPQRRPLSFVAQLGDLLDGINATLGQSQKALSMALDQLDRLNANPGLPCPSINLIGNHELYNFDRRALSRQPWLKHGNAEYYSFSPHPGFRMIVLDAYQISLIGLDPDDPRRLEAVRLLAKENPNISPDGASGSNWFDGIPKGSHQRRFVPFNGGFGREQLEWLGTELVAAQHVGERVMVLSHVAVHPKATGGRSFAWDYDRALELIRSVPTVVVAVLCGHDHGGGYHYDDDAGTHHITVASPLNKGADGSAYGIARVYDHQLEIVGPCLEDLLPKHRCGIDPRPFVGCSLGCNNNSSNHRLESIVFPFDGSIESYREPEHGADFSRSHTNMRIESVPSSE